VPGPDRPGRSWPDSSAPGQAGGSYASLGVGEFLDALAAGAPAPAAGSSLALTVAQAAALCAKAARLSRRQITSERAEELTAAAERVRTVATALIDTDAQAYQKVIAARRRAAAPPGPPGATRTADTSRPAGTTQPADTVPPAGIGTGPLADALARAADPPMRLVELCADLADLTVPLATEGNPALRGDVIAAALLTEAAARSAVSLVAINLAGSPSDPRPARARDLLAEISRTVSHLSM
jgi:formiminotetrahydrofolate cyclodeaminase